MAWAVLICDKGSPEPLLRVSYSSTLFYFNNPAFGIGTE